MSAFGGINLANISYQDSSQNELLRGADCEDNIPVSEHMVALKDVFYVNDTVVCNKVFARKLLKCNLEGSSIMVRSSKDKLYDSSEQMQINQSKVLGFLEVDKLVLLCQSTKWETYKIW
jgi:hypothetical protein